MRRAALALLVLAVLVASPAAAEDLEVVVEPSVQHVKTAPADGTTTPTISLGTHAHWTVLVSTETVHVCFTSTCATGGVPIPPGVLIRRFRASSTISVRSAGGAGVITFTKALTP